MGKRLILDAAPQRKLADVLGELAPLPANEIFPDIDDLEPLDSDPLG